jgi:hypothetical protein
LRSLGASIAPETPSNVLYVDDVDAEFVGGIAVAGAGIAEAGPTSGAGVLVTLLALQEGADIAGLGSLMIAGGLLVANESVGNAFRCGVQ